MASWNDLTEGGQLVKCSVCLCSVAKKKKVTHLLQCFQNNQDQMANMGVVQCPLSNQHILPIVYLDHHLDGNCQEAMNLLRKFFQTKDMLADYRGAPPDYNPPGIPEGCLSQHNRDLLYLLNENMFGQFRRDYEANNGQGQSSEQDNEAS